MWIAKYASDRQKMNSSRLARFWVSWVIALAGIGYLLLKLRVPDLGFDFRYFWVAGKVWRAGASPYGPAFAAGFNDLARTTAHPIAHFWVYPPYWLPVSIALAALPFALAARLWAVLNVGFLVASGWLFARSQRLALPGTLAALSLVDASVLTIWYGQTSLLIVLGCALLCWHAQTGQRAAGISGLVILALKPNIGAFFFIYMLTRRRFDIVAAALALLALMSLPSLAMFGIHEFVDFLRAIAAYGSSHFPANQPPEMTGVTNLLSLIVPDQSARLISLAGMALATLGLGFGRWRMTDSERILGMIVATLLFVPLHDYDLTLLILPLVWIASTRGALAWPAIALMAVMLRPGWIVKATGLTHPRAVIFPTSLLVSVAILATGILWLTYLVKARRREAPNP